MQAPKANENFLTQQILSKTVPRVNQSYNFKGACNLSRNLCNYVNFVFVVTNCSSVKSGSSSFPSNPDPVQSVRIQFSSPTESVKAPVTVKLCIKNICNRRQEPEKTSLETDVSTAKPPSKTADQLR